MARIVAGLGVPHTPAFPAMVRLDDPENETSRFFQRVAQRLDEARPDVIVVFDSDHLNTFFLDNMPTLSIGVAARTSGPNDHTPELPRMDLAVPEDLARTLRGDCIVQDFDVALTREFTLDHSIIVPMHYLRPAADIPIIPVFINGLVPPLPSAQRCWELGAAVGASIRSWPDHLRVAVLASGSFSLDVGGPHVRPDMIFGVPAEDWVHRVHGYLDRGDLDGLVGSTSRDQMRLAGNVGGEVLNWIAMLAAVGADKPAHLDLQPHLGHGYGFWEPR
jgi:aromatic ring-opening dioxygenase catalytic subunit (LigB family)